MDTFMSEAIILEAVLISVLLALWLTSIALRGLFWLMPVTTRVFQPIRFVADRQQGNRRRHAA